MNVKSESVARVGLHIKFRRIRTSEGWEGKGSGIRVRNRNGCSQCLVFKKWKS